MEKTAFIILFVVICSNFRRGDCDLRCYNCVSKGNDDCLDPEKYKMGKKICDSTAMIDTRNNAEKLDPIFANVYEVDIMKNTEGDLLIPRTCLKQVTKIFNEEFVLRGCQVSPTDKMDICKKVQSLKKESMNVTFCGLCNGDGCNSSKNLYISKAMFILFFSVSMVF